MFDTAPLLYNFLMDCRVFRAAGVALEAREALVDLLSEHTPDSGLEQRVTSGLLVTVTVQATANTILTTVMAPGRFNYL